MTTATCRVTFGATSAGDTAFAVFELDDTRNLNDDGEPKSQFAPGETAWLLLHLQPGYRPVRMLETHGQATLVGEVTRTRTTMVQLNLEHWSAELPYYPAGGLSVNWQGNTLPLAPVSGRTLAATGELGATIARAEVSYPVRFWSIRFDPPGLSLGEGDTYQIDVQVEVSVP